MRLPQQVSAIARKADRNAAVMPGSMGPSALADLFKDKPWPWTVIPDFLPGGGGYPMPYPPPFIPDIFNSKG